MKKITLVLILFWSYCSCLATDLNPADIAFTTFNTDGRNNFSFVLLRDISGTTQLHFTDRGWNTTTDDFLTFSGGGTLTWTYTGFLPAGTEVVLIDANRFGDGGGSVSHGTVAETASFDLNTAGDSLSAFEGPDVNTVDEFIFAVYIGAQGWATNPLPIGTFGDDASNLPRDLINRNDLPMSTGFASAWETNSTDNNYQYDCTILNPLEDLVPQLQGVSLFNTSNGGMSGFTILPALGCSFLMTDNKPNTDALLKAGDILITGYNSESPNGNGSNFSFLTLTEIAAGTIIKFTDRGWSAADTFVDNVVDENTIVWQATTNIDCGVEVLIQAININGAFSIIGEVLSGGISFNTEGDQIHAYQGPDSNPIFITSFQNNSGMYDADATTINESTLPDGLVEGISAFAVNPEVDNLVYNGSMRSGSAADLRDFIYDNSGDPAQVSVWNELDSGFVTTGTINWAITECLSDCLFSTTYTIAGGWDNGMPTSDTQAIIAEQYDTAMEGSFSACELIVAANATLLIRDGHYVEVQNDIRVSDTGLINVSSEGSIVQVLNTAETINDGSILVRKTTPLINARNFLGMSSPMDGETRDGVYGNSRAVFGIIPSNFIPFPIDLVAFPEFVGAENFLDDNNDYLDPYTGGRPLPRPGEGLLVFPSQTDTDPDQIYEIVFSQGTLHSGILSVPINYNGPATENNYNLLGNPYASAIDVTAFINANDAVNEVYYWDHLTNPSASLPGFGTSNFSMNDISIRNAMMGVGAVNGSPLPSQFMASGQGFGIKADQAQAGALTPVTFNNTMRVTGNNNDFRSSTSDSEVNKLWLNLTTPLYEEAVSQTAIGFTPLATADFDKGYDSYRVGTFISLFTTLDDSYLAIQGREAFDDEMEITMGMSTTLDTNANYTIDINDLEGIDIESTPIFLIDHFTDTFTNLKEGAYTFQATKGIYPDRFTLVFKDRDVLGTEDIRFRESVRIYPNPAYNQITLDYRGTQQLQHMVITDVQGKIVQEYSLADFDQSQQIDISTLSKGMYFMALRSDQEQVVKKLIKR